MSKMKRLILLCGMMSCALVCAGRPEAFNESRALAAQKRQPRKVATICGNPKVACETTFNFRPQDLPFRLPKTAVIYDTEPFYAIILKSVRVDNNCDTAFVPETERLQAQALFPEHKVFASRCPESLEVFYTNVSPNQNFMAVYAGRTRREAARVMAAVKATGQFPGANLRRLRAGINGT
jgi:hypothetical protein